MTKSIMKLMVMLVFSAFFFGACKSSSEKVDMAKEDVVEADKALEDAKEEHIKDMENYRIGTAAKIEENNRIVAEFKERVNLEKKSAQADYFKKIDELDKKNTDLKLKMENYNVEGKEKWEEFKIEFNRDMDELGKSFKDLTINNKK